MILKGMEQRQGTARRRRPGRYRNSNSNINTVERY